MTSIIITALLIATDAFFIGLSLGIQKTLRLKHLLTLNAIILTMCLIAYITVTLLKDFLTFNTSLIVGIIFLVMGLSAILSKPDKERPLQNLKKTITLGLVMSVDAMVGTAALAIEQTTIAIPITIGAVHFIYTFIGSRLGKALNISPKLGSIISGMCLILVGILNCISV